MTTPAGHIFISYARRDGRQPAERIEQALSAAGLPVWRDVRHLDPSQDFSSELEKAIEASSKVICCITPDVRREDSFVRRELQYSLNLRKPIVPLLFVDGGWMPIQIATVTHIDFTRQTWENGLQTLIARLNRADDATYEQVRLPEDPYREYLIALYNQIVDYLNQTVFSLITLRGASTPDAVERAAASPRSVLPMSFFATAGIQPQSQTPAHFPHFPAAVDAFGGQALLLGNPGAGKTTTLFAYARDCIARRLDDPTQPLPVLVPVATWDAVKQPPLIHWLAEQIPVFTQEALTHLIESNQALLMLDGLDELGRDREKDGNRNPTDKKPVDPRAEFGKRLKTDLPSGIRLIVSCREKDYAEIGTKLPLKGAVTLQPLDDAQMQAYLTEMPALWEALQSDVALREVARTPLLLSLFTFAYREASPEEVQQLRDLRHSPGDLRDQIITTFVRKSYEREARKPFADLKFSLEEINTLLSEMAALDINRKSGIAYMVPTSLVKRVLKTEVRIRDFTDLTTRLYLFVQHTRAYYGFIHLILRDYYAYRYGLQQIQRARSDEERSQALTTLRLLQDERTVPVFIRFLKYPTPELQLYSASALSDLKNKEAVEPLMDALAGSEAFVRRGIVTALGWLLDYRAADTLMAAATDDDDPWVQLFATTALRRLRHTGVFDLYCAALQGAHADGRRYIAGELGRLHDRRAVEVLIPLLQDASPKVRRAATRALRQLGTPNALAALEAGSVDVADDEDEE